MALRELIFRGKRIDNGEWAAGAFVEFVARHDVTNKKGAYIQTIRENGTLDLIHEVDPSTVGQYTGMNDKNGKRIFEGDIIQAHMENFKIKDFVLEVVFHNGRFSGLHEKDGGKVWMPLADGVKHIPQDKTPYMEWCEIIGNIHDSRLEDFDGD